MLKSQDVLVLLKAVAQPEQVYTYASLASVLGMSASEVHASVKRSLASGLATDHGGRWKPMPAALREFCIHGVRYAFSAMPGPLERGVPTSFGVEPLASLMASEPGEAPVWKHPLGTQRGPSIIPLYKSAPQAALADPELHRLLALLDAIRCGRARERNLGAKLLADAISGEPRHAAR